MPHDYDVEVLPSHPARSLNPAHFTAADFPSEYDNSSDAFAESATYDEAPYGHYRIEKYPAPGGGALSGATQTDSMISIDIDDTAGEEIYEEPVMAAEYSQQLQQQQYQSSDAAAVLKAQQLQARRLSLDPARFPSSAPSGSKSELFATAAEQQGDNMGGDDDENNGNNDDSGSEGGIVDPRYTGYNDPISAVDYDRVNDPDFARDNNPDTEEAEELEDYSCGFEQVAGPPRRLQQVQGKEHQRGDFEDEETAPAFAEEEENGWEVGLSRREHDAEFQDVAGQDWGDQSMTPDDDEGEDPHENI
ncbi:hypothetical protein HDU88_002962 [Geranomyces variabilis]|nr:hypothetical protein HDU88_002962 [Geranomyces variabilis]